MDRKNVVVLLFAMGLFLAAGLTAHAQKSVFNETSAQYTGKYAISNEKFGIWNGEEYVSIFLRGINLGVSVPGTQPGQLAATTEDYRRWFDLIREAGYNSIRTYTLHYPRFYNELSAYNEEHPQHPLLLLQGIWLEEQEVYKDLNELNEIFNNEIHEVVSAIHGDISIAQRYGKADGDFTTDVSEWVAGFLLGREIFPEEVALTNEANPGKTSFQGTYFSSPQSSDPIEIWMLEHLDYLMGYEKENYGKIRPVGYSSWPTLDPLTHPTESTLTHSQEDNEQVDLAGVTWPDLSAGFFIGYHAYPYYPDFIVQDPGYRAVSDNMGTNNYLGYLNDLKAHYDDIPLVIAEFGVPTSWGNAHFSPSGMHHGGLTEEQQGVYSIRMMDNIVEAGCAGGIQFSLIDEWFKQTWIVNAYSDRQYRHFWHNITAPEQNFGILSYMPPPQPFYSGGIFPGRAVDKISLSSDYSFFRVRLYMDTEQYVDDTLWIAFDTYAEDLGESILPDGTSIGAGVDTMRAEFALCVPPGGERADLFVIPSYDVFGKRDFLGVDTIVSTRQDTGVWNIVRWKTNYFYDITQYIGKLTISDSENPYDFLNAVTVYNDSIEIRMPWTLLNYSAPTVRRAMHYLASSEGGGVVVQQMDTLTNGIGVTVSGPDGLYQADRYSWDFWDYEKIVNDPPLERKKKSFFYLKDELPRFNSPPIAFADTFQAIAGTRLSVNKTNGLLANDFDIDGNAMAVSRAFGNSPLNGALELHPDGSFYYSPDDGFNGEDRFSYFVDDGYSYSSLASVTFEVDFPAGMELLPGHPDEPKFNIYPNPGKERFYIENQNQIDGATVIVTDPLGRQIRQISLNTSVTELQLADVPSGIYIFMIRHDGRAIYRRVVVQ